jgi:hypothetical protein
MSTVGFGITCFGDELYFKGTQHKLDNLLLKGHCCYVLTDNSDFFMQRYQSQNLSVIDYNRNYKSYYDKITIVKHIHQKHDVAVLLDADLHIKDYSVVDKLTKYDFLDGVSYIDTLINHPAKFEKVGQIPMSGIEWNEYNRYVRENYPNIDDVETMWEYFVAFNKNGFKQNEFFDDYEKLQVVKEFCDVRLRKEIVGAGEGISIAVSCLKNDIPIQKDMRLVSLLKNIIYPVTRHTPENQIPDYLKPSV